MYTEPRLTRSRARAQGIESFEDLSRTTVKARQTSKKTVGRPAFANVTNTAKETDNEQSLVKNLSADFSPAKAVVNPPFAQAVTADEAYEECAASKSVSEQEVFGSPDTNTEELLPPAKHEERAAGQFDTILQEDAIHQSENLATIPRSAEDYIALDASEAGSLGESALQSDIGIPVHDSVLDVTPRPAWQVGETDSVQGITDDSEAATLTPVSAVNQVLTSPLPARSSIDSRIKQGATGGNDSHLGEMVESSPTLVLHDFNNGVVPMSVMMDSMFKQGTSGAVEQLQNLHMPECNSPMQYDLPAEAVVQDQTQMQNSEDIPEGFVPAQDAGDTRASSATLKTPTSANPVVHKISAQATMHKSPTAVPEEPATAATPVHPAQSPTRAPVPAAVQSAGAAARAIPVSPQIVAAAAAAAIPGSPRVSAVVRTPVPKGIAATNESQSLAAAGSSMFTQDAATADTFVLPQVSAVGLTPMPSGISAPANTPVPSRQSQPARTPMSSSFLTTAYTPSRLSVSAHATVPLELSASATPPIPAEESVAAVTPRLNVTPVTKSTHDLLEAPAAAAAVNPQVSYEQPVSAAASAPSERAVTPAQSVAAATPAQPVGAATSAQFVSASKPAQSMAEVQPAQAVAAVTPESLTLTEQMEASDDENPHYGEGLPLPAGSPAPMLQAMSAYAGATPFPSASLTPGTATPLQQHEHTAEDNMDMKLDASNSAPAAFTPRFVACSAPDVDTSTPGLGSSRSAAKSNAMLLDSPYHASDSELSFDVGPSPPVSGQHQDYLAEQEAMNTDDRWQMEASTSNSPISYISGPVANRLGSKVHASPSYDSRSLNQLRKDLAHKLTARQGKSSIPVPAGLDQEQTGYDASPTSTAPGVTLSPRDDDELCSALESLGIQSTGKSREPLRGLPVPQGTHIRFDDTDGHAVPSPANTQVRLRGVPVPRNTHIRFE